MNAASANIVQALKSLMPASKAAKLNLDALLASNIEYTLSIRYRQSTSEDGQRLMDTLGSALRHADGVETKIKLVGGGVIKGDDLKMSGQIRIDTYDGLPSASEVFEEMRTWLLEKLKSGEVKA